LLKFLKKKPKSPQVAKIILSDTVLAAAAKEYDPVLGVVDYVNEMQSAALLQRDEIPVEAMWLYHSDYYLAQVNNGGHSQFIYNSNLSEIVLSDISKGLDLIGATKMKSCFEEMRQWISRNPLDAARQDGFGNRESFLDELDRQFYKLQKTDDGFYAKSQTWLKSSNLVKVVPRDKLRKAFDDIANSNPDYAKRKRFQNINRLQHLLTADYLALFQIAAAGKLSNDKVFEVQRLTAGTPLGHPTEDNEIVWGVATSLGVLAGYLTSDKVVVAQKGNRNGFSPEETLFECPRGQAQRMVDFAGETQAAGCAVELLAKVNREVEFRYIAPLTQQVSTDKKGHMTCPYIGVTQDEKTYVIQVSTGGSAISGFPPTKAMARISSREMARIKTETAAYNAYTPTR